MIELYLTIFVCGVFTGAAFMYVSNALLESYMSSLETSDAQAAREGAELLARANAELKVRERVGGNV
jgi:hypothetical protein